MRRSDLAQTGVAALLVLSWSAHLATAGEGIEEHRSRDAIVLVLPSEREVGSGTTVAERGKETTVVLSPKAGEPGRVAADELARGLRLACGANVSLKQGVPAAVPRGSYAIVLATADDTAALGKLGVTFGEDELPAEGCLITPLGNGRGLALIASTPRGLLDGACTVLEETVGAAWDPPRILSATDPKAYALEVTLRRSPKAVWTKGPFVDKPVLADRGLYTSPFYARDAVIDWCVRSKKNFLVFSSGRFLPIEEKYAGDLKKAVRRAQQLGLKVVFLNMTHRLPRTQQGLSASSPETIACSAALFAAHVDRFGVDGMAWHTASEGIKLNMDEAYRKRPRYQWEVDYFNSYYTAIRARHPEAILAMLMGWAYMNPAEKIAPLVPKDTVAWVVPNTPIIDVSRTDLDAYGAQFQRVWYWLYSNVSADGIFPMVKCDYLEKYCREAAKRGHGLMPQTSFRTNAANMVYLAQAGWRGPADNEKFVRQYGTRYYGGDPRMGDLLVAYQAALKRHRLWTNNIYTRRRGATLRPEESATLRKTVKLAIETGRKTTSGLIRDRLKTLAVTAIRCLTVRKPEATERSAEPDGRFPTREELLKLIDETKPVFAEHYFGADHDPFWSVLLGVEKRLQAQKAK